MATSLYMDLVGQVSPITDSCPSLVVMNAIRQTVIDLCERGQIWKYKHPDVVLTPSTYNYQFVTPNADTVISLVESARVNDISISVNTPIDAINNFPKFPDIVNTGPPTILFQLDQRSYNVAPTPDAVITYTLKLITTLKPTQVSTGTDSTLLQEHQETIVHGALHRLLLQPEQDWTNMELAGYHGKQYTYKLNLFKAQAKKGFSTANVSVQMRPFA